ncbi:lipase family protein [Allohahella marinimesophila]
MFVLDRRAWLGIRGTDEGSDWLMNLSFVPGRHVGFRKALRVGLQSEVMRWLHANHDAFDSLVITGHSLGGALSTLAADHISISNQSNASPRPPQIGIEAVITFASPRVGSPGFARQYRDHKRVGSERTLGECTYRFSNAGDIVPKVPPAVFGFRHVVESIDTRKISDSEKTISRTVNWNLGASSRQGYIPSNPLDPLMTSPRPTTVREAFVDAHGALSTTLMAVPFAYLILSGFWASDRGAMHMMTLYGNAFGRHLAFGAVEPPKDLRPWSLTSKIILGMLLIVVMALVLAVIYFTLVLSGWFMFWLLLGLLGLTAYYYVERNRKPESMSTWVGQGSSTSHFSPRQGPNQDLIDELRRRLEAGAEGGDGPSGKDGPASRTPIG